MEINWNITKTEEIATILGKDCEEIGSVDISLIDGKIGISLSPGYSPRDHPLGRINEDGVGGLVTENMMMGIIVDSHFGGAFADCLVVKAIDNFYHWKFNTQVSLNMEEQMVMIKASFKELFEQSIHDAQIMYRNSYADKEPGETTLIIVVVTDSMVMYGSIGDSVLYGITEEKATILNQDNFYFVGKSSSQFRVSYGITENNFRQLLLATDGLPECVYQQKTLDEADIFNLIEPNIETSLKKLNTRAFEEGGEDNIGLVLIDLLDG